MAIPTESQIKQYAHDNRIPYNGYALGKASVLYMMNNGQYIVSYDDIIANSE